MDTASRQPARFWAVDLHVHTPASADVDPETYGATTPEEVVQAAIDAGLDAIAITDHNTGDWVENVSNAAKSQPLVVLPGVEISTSEGHMLAIFDEGSTADVIKDLLAGVAIRSEDRGQLEISANTGFLDTAVKIVELGGLAVPAHIDRPRGLLRLDVAAQRRRILASRELAAVEICDIHRTEDVRNVVGNDRTIACIRSSDVWPEAGDCHTLAAIGRRRTWIKASRPDLVGLQHAFHDPSLRVRLEEPAAPEHAVIESLTVTGGFFGGETFCFSPDLNCLMGGTGTGKSLVVELIRFALDQQTDAAQFDKVREEVDSRLEKALGTDSIVELQVRPPGQDTITIRRAFDNGGSPAPEVWPSSAQAELASHFAIRAFSQGEIIEYAREPVGRLELVDSALDMNSINEELATLRAKLASNANRVCRLRDNIERSKEQLAALPETKQRVDELAQLFEADVVKTQRAWQTEKSRFESLSNVLESEDELRISSSSEFSHSVAVKENADLYAETSEIVKGFLRAVHEADKAVVEARRKAVADLEEVAEKWAGRHKEFEQRLTAEIAKIDKGKTLSTLRSQLREFQSRQIELEETERRLENQLQPSLDQELAAREELLERLVQTRRRRRDMREERIAALNNAMGGAVRIKLNREVDDVEFGNELERLARGSYLHKQHLRTLTAKASPVKLIRCFLEDDPGAVSEGVGVAESRVRVLFDHIVERGLTEEFVVMQSVDIGDALAVEFRKPETDQYEEIERLAHGQKCTAILVIALAEGSEPLVVDQPEDALHAPWIEEHLVSRLRDGRGLRQFIFATRSPGIVVSADAEMIFALVSDSEYGEVDAAGSLERHDLNEQALYHLEGGKAPFRRRADKLAAAL